MVSRGKFFLSFSLLRFYLDYVVLLKGVILTCFLVDGYICGIVLVELKLLQVICNRYVGLEPKREKKLKKITYSGGQKLPLKD